MQAARLFFANAVRNRFTTAMGVGTILVAAGNALVAYAQGQHVDLGTLLAAFTLGSGLVGAKDGTKTGTIVAPAVPAAPPAAPSAGGFVRLTTVLGLTICGLLVAIAAGCALTKPSKVTPILGGDCVSYDPPVVVFDVMNRQLACAQICLSTSSVFEGTSCTIQAVPQVQALRATADANEVGTVLERVQLRDDSAVTALSARARVAQR